MKIAIASRAMPRHKLRAALLSVLQGVTLLLSACYALVLYWITVLMPSFSLDFTPYYLAGRAVLQGLVGYIYDPTLLRLLEANVDLDPSTDVVPFIYPPPFLFVAVPFALLPYGAARLLWLLANLLCLSLGLYLLLRMSRISLAWARGGGYLLSLFFISYPIFNTFQLGQVNCLILLCLTLCYLCVSKRWTFGAGLALSTAIAFKFTALPLLLYFLARREWRAVIGSVSGLVGWVGISTLVFGPASNMEFLHVVLGINGGYLGMITNVAPTALISRVILTFAGADSFTSNLSDANALVANAALYTPLNDLCTVLVSLVVFVLCWRKGNVRLQFACALTGMLLISTLTWFHHLIVLSIPALILLGHYQNTSRLRKKYYWVLFGLYFILCLPPYYIFSSGQSNLSILASVPNIALIAFFGILAIVVHQSNACDENDLIEVPNSGSRERVTILDGK